MPWQGAVGESAEIGFVDDVHHTARCTQETQLHQHHRGDLNDIGAGLDAQAGAALHAPVHDGVGSLLETLLTRADLGLHSKVAISRRQVAGCGRADLRVGQRKLL